MNELIIPEKLAQAQDLIKRASECAVASPLDFKTAGDYCAMIRTLEKELEASYKAHPVIMQARELQAQKSQLSDALKAARETAKGRMIAWEEAEALARRVAEEKAAAEARRQAEEAALAEAAEAERRGDSETAEAIINEPVAAPIVVLPSSAPKVAGHVVREVWKFKVTDENQVPKQYWTLDLVKIGRVIRAEKRVDAIPGILGYTEKA